MDYTLCGNWEYGRSFFDGLLWRDAGETKHREDSFASQGCSLLIWRRFLPIR
ncbi:hypothetical protein [Virgibacillus sp. CBA3643]|uniref:hypothetical protein n=1 Tax=Virgibacillus sp. CBA3643 TaxID=2942278 RepID=UPI0035A3BF53